MGKLKELLSEYRKVPRGGAREQELAEEIKSISEWGMKQGFFNTPVKLPYKGKYKAYGIAPDCYNGNFAFFNSDFCDTCGLCSLPLATNRGILLRSDCENGKAL